MTNLNEVTTIQSTYIFFGNFSKANQKEEEFKNVFKDYKIQVGTENLSNGMPAKIYRFVKDNVAITVRAYRVDMEYGYNSPECSKEAFIKCCEDVSKMLESVTEFKANRIAYSAIEFANNENNKLVNSCNKKFNIASVFGSDAQELNIRVNHIKRIGNEDFNSVLNIQDGNVTNNATKEQVKALFINKDINTLITNTVFRFDLRNTARYLGDMILEAQDRTLSFLNNIAE